MRLRKASANDSSTNIKFSKTQLSKMIKIEVLVGELISSLGEVALMAGWKKVKEWAKDTVTGRKKCTIYS